MELNKTCAKDASWQVTSALNALFFFFKSTIYYTVLERSPSLNALSDW